ncbi:putative Glyoxalase/bleomycin resistance protein/dioxygenase [Frankia canadensis]|uniref:Putative Glyoxalase/bleomycin resistance protein/dioxygenase n=1 Tax=Frankia canadensis TaxID=1836972 RepID=A0A2I2KHW2_9ACTN|nr:VOC family protein [Frankia canadensis]SNQ45258.1 putative Glyoxalase/bleomycin resistance protein/dioxygenase [Frankia canadensis]SOU52548.1 putative Glyoxalase/bleomycin resistance protein/dioxygenase [Frankia canadensis]
MIELFHVGLCVSDLDRSIDFYRCVARMEVVEKHVRASPEFDALSGNPGSEVRVAYLGGEDGFRLQLIEYARGGAGRATVAHNRVGSPHLSFFVDDVRAEYERLEKAPNVRLTSKVVVLNPQMTSFYTADPDGVPVELLELTEPWPGVAERRHGR